MLSFSLDQAKQFLDVLCSKQPGDRRFTFQTFGEGVEKGNKRLARKLTGTLEEVSDELIRLNEAGAGIFVTINATDGQGRKIENIQHLRAVFVDDDDGSLEETFLRDENIDECQPNIIVRSRAGIHAYWLVDPYEDKLRFSEIQFALAKKYKTDENVKDLSRVMRVPGFFHMKRHGFYYSFIRPKGASDWGDPIGKAVSQEGAQKLILDYELERDGELGSPSGMGWESKVEKVDPSKVTLEHADAFCNVEGNGHDGQPRDGDDCGYRFDRILDLLDVQIIDLTPKHLKPSDGSSAPKMGSLPAVGPGEYPQEFRLYLAENYLFRIHPPTKYSGNAHETVGSACRAGHDFDCDEGSFWPILVRWGAMCNPPFVEENLRYEYDTFLRSTKYPPGTKLNDPEYNRGAQYRKWLRSQGHDVWDIDVVRDDDIPWSDEPPGGSTKFFTSEETPDGSGADIAPFSDEPPPEDTPLLEALDPTDERMLTEEKERIERALNKEELDKKKRRDERKARANKGHGHLVWTDHGDPPQLKHTADGRCKMRPYHPRETAWYFLNSCCRTDEGLKKLHYHNDRFVEWDGTSYRRYKPDGYRRKPAQFLSLCAEETDKLDESDNPIFAQFKVTKSRKSELLEALQDLVSLDSEEVQAPCWLVNDEDLPDSREVIVCQNGLLDVRSGKLMPPTPAFFSLNSVSISYDPDADKPTEFIRFLDDVFKEDEESKKLLKWWFGYCLTQDTRHQKMMMLVGKSRSGKGVITRLLKELVGHRAYGSMKFHKLASNFALSSALDKTVLVFPDARIGGKLDQSAVVADLLSITGEDPMFVDRKNLDPLTVSLQCRVMIVSNEPLKLHDTSGALRNRVLLINFSEGKSEEEIDKGLEARIYRELPGILNWAIEGWQELNARGRFFQPQSGLPQLEAFSAQSSPMNQFIENICDVGEEKEIQTKSLFEMWKIWAEIQGYKSGNNANFGKNLISVLPRLKKRKIGPRGKQRWVYAGITTNWDKIEDFISNNSNFDMLSIKERLSPPEQQKLPRLMN